MRIGRHQMFMEIAHVISRRATCFRENVGALVVKHNKVISIGYNGPPSGEPHCTHHPEGQCFRSIHAEENAIKFAGGQNIKSCDLYVTHLPCGKCTEMIINSRIFKRVFFQVIYGDPEETYKDLYEGFDGPISLLRVLPNGDITDFRRREVLDVTA